MHVRPYEPSDAAAMSGIFRAAVEVIGPAHYNADQVAAWASRTPDAAAFHARATDGRTTLIADDEAGQPVAFIDLEADGHIDLLYCAPDAARTGAAELLYDAVETLARTRGLDRIYSEASEAALRFFRKRGFTLLHRRELMIGATPIHNFAVEKSLRNG